MVHVCMDERMSDEHTPIIPIFSCHKLHRYTQPPQNTIHQVSLPPSPPPPPNPHAQNKNTTKPQNKKTTHLPGEVDCGGKAALDLVGEPRTWARKNLGEVRSLRVDQTLCGEVEPEVDVPLCVCVVVCGVGVCACDRWWESGFRSTRPIS
jgi:hypothetical protein